MHKIYTSTINRDAEHADSKRLKRLEARYDALLAQLYDNPGDEKISREVRCIEVDIVRLTGEKSTEY
ncbi:MAG: hypothetical protein LBQ73_07265 [Tannerellaceae bacterium]|jgi:hypothetical protein|nr:hypothetical protein [Tannerellaceae bacterium]